MEQLLNQIWARVSDYRHCREKVAITQGTLLDVNSTYSLIENLNLRDGLTSLSWLIIDVLDSSP
jgi:hypothetical protein